MRRRTRSEVDFKVEIDEFIQLAQRWDKLYNRLLNTLTRLPEEVYQFVLKNISFHAGQSQTVQTKLLNKPYMIILKRTDSESIIAHEIAHAYLNYVKASRLINQEEQADELRKKWGFKKSQLCCSYPEGCLKCLNPHCPRSRSRKKGTIQQT